MLSPIWLRLALCFVELQTAFPFYAGTFFRATRLMFLRSLSRSVLAKRQCHLVSVLGAVGLGLVLV